MRALKSAEKEKLERSEKYSIEKPTRSKSYARMHIKDYFLSEFPRNTLNQLCRQSERRFIRPFIISPRRISLKNFSLQLTLRNS